MNLADLVLPDQVLSDLSPPNKDRLLQALSKRAAETLRLDPGTVLNAILAREALGSTGVGMGTAIPHARLAGLSAPYVLFARLSRGIDFDSIDGTPVDLAFFVLLPEDGDRENLTLLAEISKRLRSPDFREQTRAAPGALGLYQILGGRTSDS